MALARQLTPGLILFWMIDPRSFDPFPVFSFIPARQTLLIAEQSYGCWRLYFSYFGLSFTFPQFSGFEFSDARVSLLRDCSISVLTTLEFCGCHYIKNKK